MKKILFFYTDRFNLYDIAWAFLELGYEMEFYDKKFFSYGDPGQQANIDALSKHLEEGDYWFLLSYNFIPDVSKLCEQKKIPYVAWTYDSLFLPLHSPVIENEYTFSYIYDKTEYDLLQARFHPKHMYYMPLAANISRLGGAVITDDDINKFTSEVSFVGNIYDTDEYQKLERSGALPEPVQDYIAYLHEYFTGRWNSESIYDCMDEASCAVLSQCLPDNYKNHSYLPDSYYYAFMLLSRRIANRDRMLAFERLSKICDFSLFGPIHDLPFTVNQKGFVNYANEFSKVAALSKINFHITIPRIPSGISLRCFDIMGSGGFLMANYKADMVNLFEPDRDFVMYESIDDLEKKVRYYLSHDEERIAIARNGYEKVASLHNCHLRAEEMVSNLIKAGFMG